MAGKRKATATKAPLTFPKNTPEWKKIDCGLCGAKAGHKCRNLHANVTRKLGPHGTNTLDEMAKPHDVRVAAAAKARGQ